MFGGVVMQILTEYDGVELPDLGDTWVWVTDERDFLGIGRRDEVESCATKFGDVPWSYLWWYPPGSDKRQYAGKVYKQLPDHLAYKVADDVPTVKEAVDIMYHTFLFNME
jgi:hypothetical protein